MLSSFPSPKFSKNFKQVNSFNVPPEIYEAILHLSQIVFGQNLVLGAVTLGDAAHITTDASLGSDFYVTLGGSRIVDFPTNPADNQIIRYWISQDGTGSRTLTWNGGFRFPTDLPTPTLSTTADYTDLLEFEYNQSTGTFDCIRIVKGFAPLP